MSKADEIVTLAEHLIRRKGFSAFSFREIANEIGIKSASVHYHFATKQDLAKEVAKRYTDRFETRLKELILEQQNKGGDYGREILKGYSRGIAVEVREVKEMCLIAKLGSERMLLNEPVIEELHRFFTVNIQALAQVIQGIRNEAQITQEHRQLATFFLATLEGAMLMAWAMQSTDAFDDALVQLDLWVEQL